MTTMEREHENQVRRRDIGLVGAEWEGKQQSCQEEGFGFYLPWALLEQALIFGNPIKPDIVGMISGHLLNRASSSC
ncbi:hypothetical protein RJT34_30244 [Clitoria ternatea]|uniref:Uncharacterized protein n=1 Tax=Clitoria ternatea TaxID=43366 RepID=A0AAN9ET22_CLITE